MCVCVLGMKFVLPSKDSSLGNSNGQCEYGKVYGFYNEFGELKYGQELKFIHVCAGRYIR